MSVGTKRASPRAFIDPKSPRQTGSETSLGKKDAALATWKKRLPVEIC